jgi:pimeloyl-ACP methyl ester carboxylesterase
VTTWVLLRGLARESRHWGGFISTLRAAVPPGDAVVSLDLPGNGRLWRERSPATVQAMAEAARAQLHRRRQDTPAVLVALSLGGMVALQWAARHPESVAGCVLINSSLRGLAPFWRRLRPPALLRLLALAAPGSTALARERRILQLTSNLPVDDGLAAAWADHARTAPVSRANMVRQLFAAARFRLQQPPSVPVLLLASRQDRIASVLCSRAMAQAWDAPLREHPNAGHDLALDDPEWVAEQGVAWARNVMQTP